MRELHSMRSLRALVLALSALLSVSAGAAQATSPTNGGSLVRVVAWTDGGPAAGTRPAPQPTLDSTGNCPGAMGSTGRYLTFRCVIGGGDTGWTSADRSAIGAMLSSAYARQVALYGPPMHRHIVTIVPDAAVVGYAYYQSSYSYDTSTGQVTSCTAEIHINPADGRNAASRVHYLVHEVLHAFHGCQAPPTEAVEEGMTEAASSLLRPGVASDLGIPWTRPPEPGGVYADDSGVVIADQWNQQLVSAAGWYDSDGPARPQLLALYSDAAVYWWTLGRVRGTFFRDWNAGWLTQDDIRQSAATRLSRVHAIAGGLVPRVGSLSYDAWKIRQRVMGDSHSAGVRTLCGDSSSQRSDKYMDGLVQVITTDASGDDVIFSGQVDVTLARPDGSRAFVDEAVAAATVSAYLYLFNRVGADGPIDGTGGKLAGAYRLTVVRHDDPAISVGRCWFLGGIRSGHKLLVIGDPTQTVKVTVPKMVGGSVVPVTDTQLVGADRVAIFRGVQPGIATVGLDGASPLKVIALGSRGAVVAVVRP